MTFFSFALITLASALAIPDNSIPEWHPPGQFDVRGPCPMLNALANHGFLPRNGLNITKSAAVAAMTESLNFDPAFAEILFGGGIATNPEPNANSFTMVHLRRHNVVEHDASMSRQDSYFGNNFDFNQTIFDQTRAFWINDTLNRQQLANSKLYRQLQSKAYNPTYVFNEKTEGFSLGEHAAPFIAFGDIDKITARKDWVEYFFMNERLPYSLGWTKRDTKATFADFQRINGEIAKAASLMTGSPSTDTAPGMVVQGGNSMLIQPVNMHGSQDF
ncbi:Sterigmatocystin biosynthesis peroxidase stcC-like protein 2 [Elsinoe fawcettii]|nr:Sterigmatocystin biosynthesis peroxidase stcC-like protein 2 [Elsinoe fawcettii]